MTAAVADEAEAEAALEQTTERVRLTEPPSPRLRLLLVVAAPPAGVVGQGVDEPRKMRRRHMRIVQEDGSSRPMNEILPSYSAVAEM